MVAQAATTRSELVRRLTLNWICDDYENLAVSIEMPVIRDGGACGLYIEKEEIARALSELVELGLAKAYRMGGSNLGPPGEMDRMPSLAEMEDPDGAWFYRTDAGLKVQLEPWEPWPFDDDNVLRKDWKPPED